MKIAFIGLGNMGGPMAINLHKAGFGLAAFDLSQEACQKLLLEGVAIAESATASVAGADVVISMLPASQHVESLYLGSGDGKAGLLEHIRAGALVIDCSTIAAAGAGTLTFMVGGEVADLVRARPVLEKMGANIFHAGGAGAGQTAKICNNMLLGILMIGTSEALALGVANGLDPKVLSEIMRRSSGGNWALEKYNPMPGVMEAAPASKNYAGGFGSDLMLKDLGLAQENAMSVRAATPLGGMARNLYAAHSLAGNGSLDFSSVIKMVQKKG